MHVYGVPENPNTTNEYISVMNKWKDYENLVEKIYKEINPFAMITKNDKIKGFESNIYREIDLSIKAKVSGHDILIIVQAKNIKRPADVRLIGEFASVVKDVRASKGVMICNKGFSKGAKEYAKRIGIDLCKIHDANSRDWKLDIKFPIVWIDYLPNIHINMGVHLEENDQISKNAWDWMIRDKNSKEFSPVKIFEEQWNDRQLSTEINTNHKMDFDKIGNTFYVGDNNWREIYSFEVNYSVTRKSWLGYLHPDECRGILKIDSDEFLPSYFKINEIPMPRGDSWQQIPNPDDVVVNKKGVLITAEHVTIYQKDGKGNLSVTRLD